MAGAGRETWDNIVTYAEKALGAIDGEPQAEAPAAGAVPPGEAPGDAALAAQPAAPDDPAGPSPASLLDPAPFNAVDSLILAWLSYLHFPCDALTDASGWGGVPLQRLFRAECFEAMFSDVWDPASTRRLLTAMAASPRFRDARVCGFTEQLDEEEGKQFAAVSFQLTPGLAYVAFRGTDSTLVGWKEDFNLAFKFPVPSQEEAARYLARAAGHLAGRILCGGHSKGGNLAVYAASMCPDQEVRARVARVYSHDGPGFLASVLERPEFREMAPRVDKTVPQSSVVGMLLESQEDYGIVRSHQAGVLQHDPFSWEVEAGAGRFRPVERLSADGVYMDKTLNGWIAQMSDEERGRFTDALFEVLSASDAGSLDEIKADWQNSVPAIARKLADLDPDTRDFLLRILGALAQRGAVSIPETLGEMWDTAGEAWDAKVKGLQANLASWQAQAAKSLASGKPGKPGKPGRRGEPEGAGE